MTWYRRLLGALRELLTLAGWWLVGGSWALVLWVMLWLGSGEWGDR